MTTLDELRKLLAAASPVPWRECGHERGGCTCCQVWSTSADALVMVAQKAEDTDGCGVSPEGALANARMIAALRNAAPALLAALDAYRNVAECANDQWSDDYLWKKWGLNKGMDLAREAMRGPEAP